MYYGEIHPSHRKLTSEQHKILQDIGVTRLSKSSSDSVTYKCCVNLLIEDYVDGIRWDSLMWVDADTMILRPLNEVFELLMRYDFVGHPGRDKKGLIVEENNMTRFATGMWGTSSKQLVKDLRCLARRYKNAKVDSRLVTKLVNEQYSFYQLDGNTYNFSRNIIPLAKFVDKHIEYNIGKHKYLPYTAGFSQCTNGSGRRNSKDINAFYNEVILNGNIAANI